MSFPILADLEARTSPHFPHGDRRLFANSERLTEKLTSDAARLARELYDEITTQAARISAIEAEGRAWERRTRAAEAAIETAVQKDAREAGDGSGVVKATAESYEAKAALDPEVWRRRLLAAGESLRSAEANLRAHLNANSPDLIRELDAEASRVGEELKDAEAKALKLLDPPRREYREISSTLATILGRSDFDAEDVFATHRQADTTDGANEAVVQVEAA
jgi:hypothetical protein